jgi:hypothetical protein
VGQREEGCQVRPTTAQARTGPPQDRDRPACEIVVVGAHGGAGTTTLAVLLQPSWDLGAVRHPTRDRPAIWPTWGRPLVLVTRSTALAACRAIAAVDAIACQGEHIAVLAIVSDGLPEPATATYRFQVLAARVDAVVRVPFIASLRTADDPAQASLPRGARRSIADIRAKALAGATVQASTQTP